MRGNSLRQPAPSRFPGLRRPTQPHKERTHRMRISYDLPCGFGGQTSATQYTHLYFNGRRIKRIEWTHGAWCDHYAYDFLGNARWVYGYNGAWDVSDFYPFGGERPVYSAEGNKFKFTGKERDSESGLDNFGARYGSSSMGRFMTPDWSATPAAVPFANPADPQTLNLYSYVVNNPLNRTDPNGHNWFCTSGGAANCKHWEWHKGSTYTDANGNKFKSDYTGLLTAQATGTDKKTGATLYKLTLYDQNKEVATGTGFSGGMGQPAIKDGNYLIRLDIRDPNGPNSSLNNPPQYWGIQKMHDITDSQGVTWGCRGCVRADSRTTESGERKA